MMFKVFWDEKRNWVMKRQTETILCQQNLENSCYVFSQRKWQDMFREDGLGWGVKHTYTLLLVSKYKHTQVGRKFIGDKQQHKFEV